MLAIFPSVLVKIPSVLAVFSSVLVENHVFVFLVLLAKLSKVFLYFMEKLYFCDTLTLIWIFFT